MRLCHIEIRNVARFPDLSFEVRDLFVLVGVNDVGKTSPLDCLNLLRGWSNSTSLDVAGPMEQVPHRCVEAQVGLRDAPCSI